MKTVTIKQNTSGIVQQVYVGEGTPTIPTQQKTINHVSEDNQKWPRNIQVSDEFIFLKRFGCPTVGMPVDDFVLLCTHVEPQISWPPLFVGNKITQGEKVSIVAEFEKHNPELTEEQNAISYQWQLGDDNGIKWENISDDEVFSGCTTDTISIVNKAGDRAKVLRCVATNSAGSRGGLPVVSSAVPLAPIK